MDNLEIDKETIIETSDDEKHRGKKNKKERKKKNRKQASRSISHKKERSKKHSSEYRSYSRENKARNLREKHYREDRSPDRHERHIKHKDNYEDKYKSERERQRERSREYDKRKNFKRDSNSVKRKRSSPENEYQREKNVSTYEIKKKFDEISKNNSINIPITNSDISKRPRELYLSNYPEELTPNDILELMNTALISIKGNTQSGNPIIDIWMNTEQKNAFLEFRSPEEASNALKLDGLNILGKEIKIGRPRVAGETAQQQMKDLFPTLTSFGRDLNNPYINKSVASGTSLANPYLASYSHSSSNQPTSSKLLVSNLPLNFDEESVYKFLKTFGKIKLLEMIKDPMTGQYAGQCHVEFESEQSTSNALHYGMGINLQGNILYIKRSSGLVPTYSSTTGVQPSSLGILTSGMSQYMSVDDYARYRESNASKILCIKNMVDIKELDDDDEYDDIYYDVMEECKIYGKIVTVKIPRPEHDGTLISGIGKVFVEYTNRDGASFAKDHLNGKVFHGRCVEVVYYPEDLYKKGQFD